MQLSLVVPSHNDSFGLWSTFAASFVDLERDFAPDDWEFIAVIDGETEPNLTVDSFKQWGTCRIIQGNFGGPQNARRAGALAAKGEFIVFLDSHVVPARGMFRSLIDAAKSTGACLVHAPHSFWQPNLYCYSYVMDFWNRFWVSQSVATPQKPEPYRIAVMGHGALLANAEKYFKIGGYTDLQRGWGGEEPYLNLKAYMLGEWCCVDPRTYHWHYMSTRRTAEVYQQLPYVRNFMVAAYVIGGHKFLERVYTLNTFAANGHKTEEDAANIEPTDPYRSLLESIPPEAAEERAAIEAGPFQGDMDKLVEYFAAQEIPH